TTASRAGEASAANGIHFPGSPHRPALAARSFPAHAPRWGRGRGRTNGRGLPGEPAGEPAGAVGTGQVRHVPGSAGASGADPERDGPTTPPDRHPDVAG